jgi:hypothetical protein
LSRAEAEHSRDVRAECHEGEIGEVENAGESELQVQPEYDDAVNEDQWQE